MAKKQKKELSPEERLAAARVPEEEWPYKLPEGWEWVRLEGIIDEFKNGTTIKQDKSGNGVSVTRIESLQNQTIDFSRLGTIVNEEEIKESDWYRVGDIALSHINSADHVGKTALITREMLPLVHGMNLLRLRFGKYLLPKLFQLYSQSLQYKEAVIERINRAVNQVSINQKQIKSIPFPLPPLEIQQQIVVNIESLFAKLDQAEEKALQTLATAETRKAAILHQAFTGKLTEKWRAENSVSMEEWETVKLKDVCEKITDGTHHSPQSFDAGEYMYVTAKNIKEYGIDLNNITYVSKDVHDEIYSRCDVRYGDVLYIKDGATTGIATVNTIEEQFSLLSSVAVLRPVAERLDARYLTYNLNSAETKAMMINNMSGNAITRLTLKKIKDAEIMICSLHEQQEIVRILDELLAKEQQITALAEAVLDEIEATKKSILAKAFRGEWHK